MKAASYTGEGREYINAEGDIVTIRRAVRKAATDLGFTATDVTRVVTAASELARNVHRFAGSGHMTWRHLRDEDGAGIELTFRDEGPGIQNVEEALAPGFTTAGGLGMGLSGAKRLMDEMDIQSNPGGKGTVVTVRKWLKKPATLGSPQIKERSGLKKMPERSGTNAAGRNKATRGKEGTSPVT